MVLIAEEKTAGALNPFVFICGNCSVADSICAITYTYCRERLLTNVKLFEDSLVALGVFILEKIQKTAALADHLQ